jgi:hypothetical protein
MPVRLSTCECRLRPQQSLHDDDATRLAVATVPVVLPVRHEILDDTRGGGSPTVAQLAILTATTRRWRWAG